MTDKMYICVLDQVPDHMVPVLVAHATLRHHLASSNTDQRYNEWLETNFKKCVVKVNAKEFLKVSNIKGAVLSHENTTLGGSPSCVTVIAHTTEHNVLKYARLWAPRIEVNNG